ncbi:hypothetical protein HOY80DRAFT_958165 [Tuber brumale]|nr:hypothetical protein HOY80DRAFT_958165 [Tuber brumale]
MTSILFFANPIPLFGCTPATIGGMTRSAAFFHITYCSFSFWFGDVLIGRMDAEVQYRIGRVGYGELPRVTTLDCLRFL